MTTACWGNNTSFDCAWVSFGYGSRYDMIGDYHDGWWVSLDTLKVLVKYDYALTPENCPSPEVTSNIYEPNWYDKDRFIKEKLGDYILCERYDIKSIRGLTTVSCDGEWGYDYEKWNTMSLLLQMRTTAIHINHPNAAEWFGEIKKHSGLFNKENPDYSETTYYNGGSRSYVSNIPSLRAIQNINYADWEIISRVEFMNKQAMEGEWEKERFIVEYRVLFDDADEMFKELDKE